MFATDHPRSAGEPQQEAAKPLPAGWVSVSPKYWHGTPASRLNQERLPNAF